ncbi:MAG: phage holin family protein [Rhodocyclales bacterium]|nr:phage holin family protein [Rhodocyclales bacterium]
MKRHAGPMERIFGASRRLLEHLLEGGEMRLRLAVLELEEERARLFDLFLLAGLSLVLATLGLAFVGVLVIATFWETHRLVAIAAVAAVFLLGAVWAAWQLRRLARRRSLLRATLEQLATDRQLLAEPGEEGA